MKVKCVLYICCYVVLFDAQVLKVLEKELVNMTAMLASFLLQENTKLPWIGMIVGLHYCTTGCPSYASLTV